MRGCWDVGRGAELVYSMGGGTSVSLGKRDDVKVVMMIINCFRKLQ